MKRYTRKRGGANNNNNHNNNTNNNNESTIEDYGENLEFLVKMSEGDVEWFRQQLDSGKLRINANEDVSFQHREDQDLSLTFQGTLLSYLPALDTITREATRHIHYAIGGPSEEKQYKLLELFLKYKPDPNEILRETSPDIWNSNIRDIKPLTMFMAEDNEKCAMLLLKYIAGYRKLTNDDINEYIESLDNYLYIMHYTNKHRREMIEKWTDILYKEIHQEKLKNIRSELSLLPAMPESGFPGGNNYRQAESHFYNQMKMKGGKYKRKSKTRRSQKSRSA